jgi:RNA polymerase I-associated factor PAF67
MAEKMLALLALCSAVLPHVSVDEILRRALNERFGDAIERISAGDTNEVEKIFLSAAPGYFTWTPTSSPSGKNADANANVDITQDSIRATSAFHLAQLQKDVAQRTGGFGGLRAHLRLYTSIGISKLAEGTNMSEEDVRYVFLEYFKIYLINNM